jgi:hypothetical protein
MKAIPRVSSKLRLGLALVLIAWCAGTGCLLSSYARERVSVRTEPSAGDSQSGWGGLSASAGEGSSCHARHQARQIARSSTRDTGGDPTLSEAPGSSESSSCCPLMSASFVSATRADTQDEKVASARVSLPPAAHSSLSPAPLAPPLRLPHDEQTYLRVCVFLI